MDNRDIVDGWQIAATNEGAFNVIDSHGILAGPFGTREKAIAAALQLPKPGSSSNGRKSAQPDLRDVEPGSDADAIDN